MSGIRVEVEHGRYWNLFDEKIVFKASCQWQLDFLFGSSPNKGLHSCKHLSFVLGWKLHHETQEFHTPCPNWYTKSRLSYCSFHLNQWKWPLRDLKWPDLKNYDKFDISNTIQLVKAPMIDQWMINESMMLIQIEFILTGLRSQILHFVYNHFIWFTSY